jgi:hypothetical protein
MEMREVKDFTKDFEELLAEYELKVEGNLSISFDCIDNTYLIYVMVKNVVRA